ENASFIAGMVPLTALLADISNDIDKTPTTKVLDFNALPTSNANLTPFFPFGGRRRRLSPYNASNSTV
uniref:hypothetical protein n=1 Tax=Bifidobacterium longum TaxID=216816 RepID=UPI0015C3F474